MTIRILVTDVIQSPTFCDYHYLVTQCNLLTLLLLGQALSTKQTFCYF